ncbi:MAG: cohesin domain-containing protein, partial [Planctomycetes bacterium]|nr:cohesin domain-containing protein [Planctomycetota bacterium]
LDSSPPSMRRSWYVRGDNLEQLGANPYPPILVDDLGYPGNWLVRCRSSYKDCNGNDVLDACDIEVGTSYDNNLSEIPDECELGTAVDLMLMPDAPCYSAGHTVTVEIWMNGSEATIVGGQFFLDYDETRLELVDLAPASPPSPFTQEVYECSTKAGGELPQCEPVVGTIDYAVGILPDGSGASGSAQMAVMTFNALQPICSGVDLLTWRPEDVVRLGTDDATPLYPLLTHVDMGDDTPPTLTVPPDVVTGVDTGEGCVATLDPGFVTAEDDCTDVADIIITWERSDGYETLTHPYNVADSPITITWYAEDECGNLASDVTIITVRLLGDLDYDADVDLADLAQLLGHYGMASGASYEDGDLDGDGDVELSDLAILLSVYGNSCP